MEGTSFAIPINTVQNILPKLLKTPRSPLGLLIVNIIPKVSDNYVRIEQLNSLAARSTGLQENDVILQIDDTEITSVKQMIQIVNDTPADKDICFTVKRKIQPQEGEQNNKNEKVIQITYPSQTEKTIQEKDNKQQQQERSDEIIALAMANAPFVCRV
mmetsp:Transcript_28531/g.32629  ORF Transcript_28531/g.32629 Transcript_28531/m.32629 type:complete len:158 (-) Transcript_28531:4-477(-)